MMGYKVVYLNYKQHMAYKHPIILPSILENISKVLGDSVDGYSNTEIVYNLQLRSIEDPFAHLNASKWKRIYNAFINYQNTKGCSNNIYLFIRDYFSPNRFVNNLAKFNEQREKVNLQLRFCGFEITEKGTIINVPTASTISDAHSRAQAFNQKLHNQNAHPIIFQYAKAELIVNDYFHAVLEAVKGLYERIRDYTGSKLDGSKLIQAAFFNDPAILINSYTSQSDKDEHRGFSDVLQGLNALVRNPQSHTPRINANFTEQDAIEIFALISYCHRKLDNCSVKKRLD